MATTNKQCRSRVAPAGRADAAELQARRDRRCPTLQDGEVLVRTPLPQPRPLHARPHERRQELRAAAAARRSDGRRHGGRSGRVAPTTASRPATRSSAWAAGSSTSGRRRPAAACCSKVDTSRVPLSAYLGAVGMPGVTAWYGLTQIIAPKAGRDRGGQRRQRRGRRRRRPACQGARLPRGGHRRRRRQVRLRGRRARLRRLHRLQAASRC